MVIMSWTGGASSSKPETRKRGPQVRLGLATGSDGQGRWPGAGSEWNFELKFTSITVH